MRNKIVAGMLLTFVAARAAAINSVAFVTIPALDDLGLVGLTLVVAIAGGFAARRRKK